MEKTNDRRQTETKRLSRRALLKSTVAAAAALGLAACGGEEETPSQEGSTTTLTPPSLPTATGQKSIASGAIIVVLDSLRADHVGCYGNDWIRTPAMDALARESIVFTRAFPESLPTIPMRLALHTGLRSWPFLQWERMKGGPALWAGWEPIPEDRITLSEILVKQGFQTGFVTDTYHYFTPAMNFHRGFKQFLWVRGQEGDPYRSTLGVRSEDVDAVFNPDVPEDREGLKYFHGTYVASHLANQAGRSKEEDYQAPRVFLEAMNWLEENKQAERFLLLVDSFDPHEPWDPPQEYVDRYDPGYKGQEIITPVYGPSDYLSEAELKHMRARYAGEVTLVDKWLGVFLEHARDLGLLDKALLIVTSDHGHQLGEHGLTGKVPQSLCHELVDVPLFVRHPDGVGAGTRVEVLAQHHDILPTVLNTVAVPPEVPLPGIDLLELAAGRIPPRDHVSCGLNDYSWCRDQRYTYMTRNDGSDAQLFDMTSDPLQEHNLAAEEKGVAEEMHKKLLADAGGALSA